MAHLTDGEGDEELKRAIAMSLQHPNPAIDEEDEDDEDLKQALAMSLEDSGPAFNGSESPVLENGDGKAFKPFVLGQNQGLMTSRLNRRQFPA
jgi:hypothetical protein